MSLINHPLERGLSHLYDIFDDVVRIQRPFHPYWRHVAEGNQLNLGSTLGEVENTKEKFGVSVDVSHFEPDEVHVNVDGNLLTVEGRHQEKDDAHGTIQRSFVRKFCLPEDTDTEKVSSSLSNEGKLSIVAPKKASLEGRPRSIPIMRS